MHEPKLKYLFNKEYLKRLLILKIELNEIRNFYFECENDIIYNFLKNSGPKDTKIFDYFCDNIIKEERKCLKQAYKRFWNNTDYIVSKNKLKLKKIGGK